MLTKRNIMKKKQEVDLIFIEMIVSLIRSIFLCVGLLLFAFVFQISSFATNAETYSGNEENISWILDDSGRLTISGIGEMPEWNDSSFTPKWSEYSSNIKEVVIKNGITSIGAYAFFDCEIQRVYIPLSVVSIGFHSFSSWNLENIYYEGSQENWRNINGVMVSTTGLSTANKRYDSKLNSDGEFWCENFHNGLFYELNNDKITIVDYDNVSARCIIPEQINGYTVTEIGEEAFEDCEEIYIVTIPNTVTTIGDYAFKNCVNLNVIAIPNSVRDIGVGAFEDCKLLTTVTIVSGIDTINSGVFAETSVEYVDIPNGVITIGSAAFDSCEDLQMVIIPSTVSSIEKNAFDNCGAIENIYYQGDENDWNSIVVGEGNAALENANVFFNCFLDENETMLRDDFISKGRCGPSMYWSLSENYELIISGTGKMFDWHKPNLAPWYVFSHEINTITIDEGVEKIGKRAFFYLYSATTVNIPNSVTEIGEWAFEDCSSLKYVIFDGSKSEWSKIFIDEGNDDYISDDKINFDRRGFEGYLVVTSSVAFVAMIVIVLKRKNKDKK